MRLLMWPQTTARPEVNGDRAEWWAHAVPGAVEVGDQVLDAKGDVWTVLALDEPDDNLVAEYGPTLRRVRAIRAQAGGSAVEVGTCDLCGQEMLRTADDCWHPYTVARSCPPEPPSTAGNRLQYLAWVTAGNRSLRPGREHFVPAFTCPRCGRTSANPNDLAEGYCGACHDWTGWRLFGGIEVWVDPSLPADVIELRGANTVRIQLPEEPAP